MEAKQIQKEKIQHVEIDYGFDSDEWQTIRIRFKSGLSANVNREDIATFLRMSKIVEDIKAVESLRDQLLKIFGAQPSAQIQPP